jgi:hypothetical protein
VWSKGCRKDRRAGVFRVKGCAPMNATYTASQLSATMYLRSQRGRLVSAPKVGEPLVCWASVEATQQGSGTSQRSSMLPHTQCCAANAHAPLRHVGL